MLLLCAYTCVLPFSFQRSRAHRYLHSFPTRRSSDLGSPSRGSRLGRRSPGGTAPPASRPRSPGPPRCGRSEEHTSELQSHHDLVCRLLLEKKKQSHTPHPLTYLATLTPRTADSVFAA